VIRLILAGFFLLLPMGAVAGDPVKLAVPTPETTSFFENKVRPLLVEHCLRCHGDKKQQGQLRLDTAVGVAAGADGEAVIAPGKPDDSKLIHSVRRNGDYAMPPDKPLTKDQVEILTAWVKLGAPFPADATTVQAKPKASDHWAFKPIADSAVPAGPDANPIDRFLEAKLKVAGLGFADAVSREAMIRRAYFDLIGLPPTVEQVQRFVADPSPTAYETVLEELLASPHYGERWGRWWLDIARYADSKGYVFNEDRNYPHAYTFRDYVIRSLNEDKPYDRFVIEQIAADLLPQTDDRKQLAAMGFLTVGRRFSNNPHDIIDDRIDVVTRGLMGLTVQCARCHDHKFDPVGIGDYYSLYGVFAASTEPKEYPVIGEVPNSTEYAAFHAEVTLKEKAIVDYKIKRHAEILAELRKVDSIANYLTGVKDLTGKPAEAADTLARERSLRQAVLSRWRDLTAKDGWPERLKELTDAGNIKAFAAALLTAETRVGPPTADELMLRKVFAAGGPFDVPFAEFDKLILRDDRNKLVDLQKKLDAFRASSKFNPPRAMVLNDLPAPGQQQIFLRGNPNNRGPVVPRQFVSLVGETRKPFAKGSGRLELAQAVVDPKNPLTARVLVNRVWLMHFGKALVATPSDFGLRSDTPTHPELLDWLSTQFVKDGWSLKKLHRRLMLSRAYRQSAEASAASVKVDPENRLLSHHNRRRLDFESLHDSLLAVSGNLDRTVFGRSVNLFGTFPSPRRAIYASIDRQNLPGTFRNFDFPAPDTHSPQRYLTTVPQQALFFLNSPFAVSQARTLARSPYVLWHIDPGTRVTKLYRTILQRKPNPTETALGVEFLKSTGPDGLALFAQALLCSNEFAFVD